VCENFSLEPARQVRARLRRGHVKLGKSSLLVHSGPGIALEIQDIVPKNAALGQSANVRCTIAKSRFC